MVNRSHRFLTDTLLHNPVFGFCLGLYLVFRLVLWQWPDLPPGLLRNYLPDVLCLPLVLTAATLIQRHLLVRNRYYQLNKWQVLFTVGYFSVLFEVVFPHFYSRYTADVLDVFAYAFGGAIYWWKINPKQAGMKMTLHIP